MEAINAERERSAQQESDKLFDESRVINLAEMSKEAQYVCMRLCSWTTKAFEEGGTLEQVAPHVDAYLQGVHQVISACADPSNTAAQARKAEMAREKLAQQRQHEEDDHLASAHDEEQMRVWQNCFWNQNLRRNRIKFAF